ncbi:Unannotated [Lentimonas sp. CC19]|nr:Unannotated [Lentimonas sp. CC19]CAA6693278.1 Unannotated [Lentimonas sp. CC10]CAA7071774.1 Unannotated [Lentimonas sp. CC11]
MSTDDHRAEQMKASAASVEPCIIPKTAQGDQICKCLKRITQTSADFAEQATAFPSTTSPTSASQVSALKSQPFKLRRPPSPPETGVSILIH